MLFTEKEVEPNQSLPSVNNPESEVNEENSNSTDSISTKDQNTTDKEGETTSTIAAITKEELLQNYIDVRIFSVI